MPGKNTQDWTADEDFWNEAWGDMEQRLDGKRKRRGVALWLRWLVPLVLLLAGAGFVFSRQHNHQETPDLPVSEQVAEGPVVASVASPGELPESVQDDNLAEAESLMQEEGPLPAQVPVPAAVEPANDAADRKDIHNAFDESPEVPPAATLPVSAASTLTVKNPATSVGDTAPAAPPKEPENQNSSVVKTEVITTPDTTKSQQTRPVVALEALPTLHHELPLYDNLPQLSISKASSPLPFGLETGLLLADRGYLTGYYAGIFTELRADKKVSFPVSLRYRKDRLRTEVGRRNSRNEALADVGLGMNSGQVFNFDLAAGLPPDELLVTSLSLGTGASFRLSPRLRAGLGLSGSYLLSVRGITDLTFDNDVYNFVVSSNNDPTGFSGTGQTPTAESVRLLQSSSLSLGDNTGLHRFQLRTHVNLSYRILPRLNLTGSIDVRTTPLFKSDLLRARPAQFSLGMRYRIK